MHLIYNTEVAIESNNCIRLVNPVGIIVEQWPNFELDLENFDNLSEFADNLSQLDLMNKQSEYCEIEGRYRKDGFLQGIENFYLKNREKNERFCIEKKSTEENFSKVAKEHFLHMSEIDDYISYFQILEKFPVSLQPSYLLRQCKNNSSYLDVFLQKNPNQFYISGI